MKKALIFPGAFQYVKNYGGYDGLDIWLKSFPDELPVADYYIGHSGGVNFILSHYNSIKNGKFILVNPLIKKENFLFVLIRWFKFFFTEGISWRKVTPIRSWLFGIKRVLEILNIDVLDTIIKIPKENITIIRGKNDNYFCDKKSVEILKNKGFKVLEVDAGHDWNENIAKVVKSCII
ncbi:MAG: hypothetical protein KGL67_00750 [Patescibacteria group bacterium]|nr:hypothetical protein [Patescibacteria group bacterium]